MGEKMSSRINDLEEEVRKLKAENCRLSAETAVEKRKLQNAEENLSSAKAKLKEEISKKSKSIADQLKFWNNEKSDLDETISEEWTEPSFDDISEDNNMNVHLLNLN